MKKLLCAMGLLCLLLTACGERSAAESASMDDVSTSDAVHESAPRTMSPRRTPLRPWPATWAGMTCPRWRRRCGTSI